MTRHLIVTFLLAAIASAQTNTFRKGEVIKRVVTAADPGQSYALYLPRTYDPAETWPVLIAFDPGALGYRPVTFAKEAAEEFGYIVVASNNSENGTPEPERQAAQAVWDDIDQRLSIDTHRTYFAGLSGASRLAVQLTASCHGCAAGVLACGAAFPINQEPNAAAPFLYFGAYGRDDFNFPEYIDLEPKLKKAKFTYHFRTFDGGHEWPPTDVWHDALAWFNLQAMKSGVLAKDNRFIAQHLSQAMAAAAADQDDLDRFRAYSQIVSDFGRLADTTEAQKLAAALDGSKSVHNLLRREQQDIRDQQRLAAPVSADLEELWMPDSRAAARVDLARLFADIDRRAHSKDPREQRVAKRARAQTFIQIYEAAMSKRSAQQYSDALVLLDVIVEAAGRAPGAHVQKARIYMLMGNKNKALSEARLAVKDGLADPSAFAAPEFDDLKSLAEFKALFSPADAKKAE